MAKLGYVSAGARRGGASSAASGSTSPSGYFEHRQPYFFDYVENKLIERLRRQHRAQGRARGLHDDRPASCSEVGLEAMRSALPYSTDPSSALVSIDPRNGQIRAMVSSSSYDESQFNLAAQGHRQPGSTFKAFVLTTAIKQGIDPYSTYYTSKPLDLDLPQVGPLGGAHRRRGLPGHGQPAAGDGHLRQHRLRPARPRRRARERRRRRRSRWGSRAQLDGIPAEGIGGLRIGVSPLEMADAYATLAAGGIHRDPVAISRSSSPAAGSSGPQQAEAASGCCPKRSPTR